VDERFEFRAKAVDYTWAKKIAEEAADLVGQIQHYCLDSSLLMILCIPRQNECSACYSSIDIRVSMPQEELSNAIISGAGINWGKDAVFDTVSENCYSGGHTHLFCCDRVSRR
jgi:hypothetical protein